MDYLKLHRLLSIDCNWTDYDKEIEIEFNRILQTLDLSAVKRVYRVFSDPYLFHEYCQNQIGRDVLPIDFVYHVLKVYNSKSRLPEADLTRRLGFLEGSEVTDFSFDDGRNDYSRLYFLLEDCQDCSNFEDELEDKFSQAIETLDLKTLEKVYSDFKRKTFYSAKSADDVQPIDFVYQVLQFHISKTWIPITDLTMRLGFLEGSNKLISV